MEEVPLNQLILKDKMLILGAPGIGKTTYIREYAEEQANKLKRKFIDFDEVDEEELRVVLKNPEKYYVFCRIVATQIHPEDIMIPEKVTSRDVLLNLMLMNMFSNTKLLEEYIKEIKDLLTERTSYFLQLPPLWVKVLSRKGIKGILFIDEITNVQRDDVITIFFALVNERKFGFTRISDDIKIILAGNEAIHSSVARPLPAPLLNRLTVVRVAPPTLTSWVAWMDKKYENRWERVTYAYLHNFKQDFIVLPKEVEGFENFPTPRSWTMLSLFLYEVAQERGKELLKMSKEEITKLYPYIRGYIGSEVGTKFLSFLTKFANIPSLETVLNNPEVINKLDLEAKILTIYMLSQNHEKINKKVVKYLCKHCKELMVLLVLLLPRKVREDFVINKYPEELEEMYYEVFSDIYF